MNVVPIIIPVQNEATCPKCGKEEKIVELCDHCGYEYPKCENFTCLETIMFVLVIIVLIFVCFWFAWTVIDWLACNQTLLEILQQQWLWISSKRIY